MQAQKPEQLADPESLKHRAAPWRLVIIATIVLVSAATFGVRLWLHASRFADTDNAVVSGHVQPVSTRIAGVVVEIAVQDNQSGKHCSWPRDARRALQPQYRFGSAGRT